MKNSKRITIVVKFFWPVAAGIEVNIMETYSYLVKRGWKVNLITTTSSHIEKNIFKNRENVRGINVFRKSMQNYLFRTDIPWKNTEILALHNCDVFPHGLILANVLVRRILGLKTPKIVLTPHGGFNPEWSTFGTVSRVLKRLYHQTLCVLLINLSVDSVRAVSEWEKLEMIKTGVNKDKIHVISNGVETIGFKSIDLKASKEIKADVNKWGKYIIQIGRIYPIKNYETTIKALAKTNSNLNYVIVGPISDLEYKEKLDELITSLKLTNRVFFAGVIRGVDKFYVIKKAKLMVHMALWESFCNVIHEGMSQGLPIIAANNTALPFLVKNDVNGFCLETKNNSKLANKITWLLSAKNKSIVSRISKNNVNFAKSHTWTETAKKMNLLYKSLIKQ